MPFMGDDYRDAYGFTVRPQHLQRYREYSNIYKVEEEERSDRWRNFLEMHVNASQVPVGDIFPMQGNADCENKQGENEESQNSRNLRRDRYSGKASGVEGQEESSLSTAGDLLLESSLVDSKSVAEGKTKLQIWSHIRPSLKAIEHMMCVRIKKKKLVVKAEQEEHGGGQHLSVIDEAKFVKGTSEDDSEEEFYDMERSDSVQEVLSSEISSADGCSVEPLFPWKEELECLVREGVPMALRGELWQAFVGVRARRVENYYECLLTMETGVSESRKSGCLQSEHTSKEPDNINGCLSEKWKGQIEKDLPRTFPGHPALDDDGRNALRRLLTAYARHNPSVGYCQAMNFFAGLLLLLMPEENAFWTLLGIIDDYFDGYYTEDMVESQVDQLVFEVIVRERYPKLVNHLDFLGVQVAWATGPWFLSIFVNILPWESVLRVWDVLLFEGNRVMLFRTALALMELYGPALATTKDAGDAMTLLQALAGSTFDSSQLVLTACMGYQTVSEEKLQELREKHRPSVLAVIHERAKGIHVFKDSQSLASKLYSFKHDPGLLLPDPKDSFSEMHGNGHVSLLESHAKNVDDFMNNLTSNSEVDFVPDLQEQVMWLKGELCRLLEDKRSAVLRAEELETALMEMVKQDNRRLLSARVEQLGQEVAELKQALSDKQEQEHAMLQVLMRVEQEQRVTEDARRFAEQDAAAQRYAARVLQEKYEEAMSSLAVMEKRVVMAETMLEATLQYHNGQERVQGAASSPRAGNKESSAQELPLDQPARKAGFLSRPFALGWRDWNKVKPSNSEEIHVTTPANGNI